jgi:hypothetical protein
MRHRVISGLALLALAGSLVAGCSSAAKAPASSTTSSPAAATTASASVSASASAAGALPAADCAVIKPIASGAATSLAPVATEPSAAAATTMATYITQLSEALAKVTSTQGKADLGAFIADLKTASAANAAAIQAAIQKLSTDCP